MDYPYDTGKRGLFHTFRRRKKKLGRFMIDEKNPGKRDGTEFRFWRTETIYYG